MDWTQLLGDESSFTNLTLSEKDILKQIMSEEFLRREISSKPIQVREIVDIRKWIESEYYVGPDAVRIYDYWKDLLAEIFDSNRTPENRITEVILSGCFTGDTKISLLDGRELSMIELVEEFGMHTPFWVYSCDKEGNIVPGKAFNVRKTGSDREIVSLTLSNGRHIKCTPNHLFLLRNGEYKRADELTVDDSLMDINRKHITLFSIEYLDELEDVYDFEVEEHHNFALSIGVVVHNSIGTGKSTIGELIFLRKIYELSCYKNINALFELMLKTHITLLYFSVNKTQAERTGFGEMRSWVDSSPYFNECFKRVSRLDSMIMFPENIIFAYGSGTQHSIGMSVLGSILDEANFFRGSGEVENSKVSELYSSIVNRSNSRFIIQGGINYSLNILISSSTHESSFTEQRIAVAVDNPHTIVRCPTQWEVKPEKFSGKFFYVCKGTNFLEPFIVHTIDDVNQYKISESLPKSQDSESSTDLDEIKKEIETLPEFKKSDFLSVPLDLKSGFETNILKSLQDMGGVSVAHTGRLFTSQPVFFANCRDYMRHPFVSESIVISTGDNIKIQDYLKKDYIFQYPDRPRYLHIDQSLVNDFTGISCVFIKEIVEKDNMKKPIIGVDFMLRIEPPKPPRRIAIYKMRDFIVYLNIVRKLKLGKVTYDIFNSEESRQILEEMGYNVGYQSVDRNDKAYVDTVTLLYEERIEMYEYEPFKEELFTVLHDRRRRKVDHPKSLPNNEPGCFLGDTKIKLLNGSNVAIRDLVGKEDVELYGCLANGTIVPVIAKKIFKTKDVRSYTRITLDNGEILECTEDHLFMLRDGSYKEAQYLTKDDSLMPLYFYKGKQGKYFREEIKDNNNGRYIRTHRLVYEYYHGSIPKGYVVHHKNFNCEDNRAENLELLYHIEHEKLHGAKNSRDSRLLHGLPEDFPIIPSIFLLKLECEYLTDNIKEEIKKDPNKFLDPEFQALLSLRKREIAEKKLRIRNKTKKMRDISSSTMRVTNLSGWWKSEKGLERRKELSQTQLVEARKLRMSREDKEWLDRIDKNIPIVDVRHAMSLYGGGRVAVDRRLKMMDIDFRDNLSKVFTMSNEELNNLGLSPHKMQQLRKHYNHRVVSVEYIKCEPTPVYDIEVPLTSNFALTAGVFVHNSKDVSDSLVGAVENALQSTFIENTPGDGIQDFLRANSPVIYDMYGSPIKSNFSIDHLVENELDRMIGDF